MRFKAKLRKIGNSQGIYIPLKVITGYNIGEEIEVEVITKGERKEEEMAKVITTLQPYPQKPNTVEDKVITTDIPKKSLSQANKYEMCPKHPGSMKITCGCK